MHAACLQCVSRLTYSLLQLRSLTRISFPYLAYLASNERLKGAKKMEKKNEFASETELLWTTLDSGLSESSLNLTD